MEFQKGNSKEVSKLTQEALEANIPHAKIFIDVFYEKFVDALKSSGAVLLGLSAILITTSSRMNDVIQSLITAGIRNKVKVIVGGAPLTEPPNEIGADGYAPEAISAIDMEESLLM